MFFPIHNIEDFTDQLPAITAHCLVHGEVVHGDDALGDFTPITVSEFR